MFRDREDAAHQLAERLKGRKLYNPLVLAIPRGGVVTGAVLAKELAAELDVVLSRKLRAPGHPELAVGAIAEDGVIHVNRSVQEAMNLKHDYIIREGRRQLAEIHRRRELFRKVRAAASMGGRTVIVTDDGIATGSTMIAALRTVNAQGPQELIVAVPVASPDRLEEIGRLCDHVVCLLAPEDFRAVGQFYDDFAPVEDEQVVELLREFGIPPSQEEVRQSKLGPLASK